MSSGSMVVVDAAGRRRSPATIPGHLTGRAPRNKGMQYPPDPPRAEEIALVMRQAGHDRHGLRLRALIAVLWRAGLRISEALALNETDVDAARGSLLSATAKATSAAKPGWISSASSSSPPGWLTASRSPSVRCSASLTAQPAAAVGRRPPLVLSYASSPLRQGSVAGSRPISCATRTPSNSRERAWRSTSSNASSATPTSEPPRPTFKASTRQRSSPLSYPDANPPSQQPGASRSNGRAACRPGERPTPSASRSTNPTV